jgi:hypothetical protein
MNGFLVLLAALDAVINPPPKKKSRQARGRSFVPPPKGGSLVSQAATRHRRTGRNRPVRQP